MHVITLPITYNSPLINTAKNYTCEGGMKLLPLPLAAVAGLAVPVEVAE